MPHLHWADSPSQFVLSCITLSIGLGNVWRFPYMAYENGGGPFVAAYIIVVVILGIPLYFLEVTVGQFSGKTSYQLFSSLAPAFTGIGIAQTFCMILAASYYCPFLSITLYYLVKSLNFPLPWSICHEEYANKCIEPKNSTTKANMTSSTELFLRKSLLQEFDDLDHGLGDINWKLAVAMSVTWFGVVFVLSRSARRMGNFNFIVGLFPYFVMFTLLGVAMAQKGSLEGLQYLLNPDWPKLFDPKVWFNAVSQCFYSLGLGFGTLTVLSSYNDYSNQIFMVSMVVPLIDTCTSLLCGITSFAILGNMAERFNTSVDEVISSGGVRILFVAYPEILGQLTPAPYIIALLCFAMIYVLGFASLVALQRAINGQLMDCFNLNYWQAVAASTIICFLIGLNYITKGGIYVLQLVDHFGVAMLLYILVVFEVLSIVYGYGLRNICWDIEYMTTEPINIWFRFVWGLVTPISLILIFCGYLVKLPSGIKMKGVEYSLLALKCGWALFLIGIALILFTAIWQIWRRRDDGCTDMFWNIFDYDGWEPASELDISAWRALSEQEETDDNLVVDFFKGIVGR